MAYKGLEILPDNPLNPFRTKPPEGQIMILKKLVSDGEFHSIIASVKDWHFANEEKGYVQKHPWDGWELRSDFDESGNRSFTPRTKNMPEAKLGIVTVGPAKALHMPHLRYTKWLIGTDGKGARLEYQDTKNSPYFFFHHTMSIPAQDIESRGTIKTTIVMNLVVQLMNPYLAQFVDGGWESLLDAAVHATVRDHLSDLTVTDILAERENGGLIKAIMALNEDSGRFLKKFGIKIFDVRFVGFEVKSGEKVTNALEAKEVARLLAEAAVEDAKRIKTLGTAEGEAAAEVVAGYGGNAVAAALVEMSKNISGMFKK